MAVQRGVLPESLPPPECARAGRVGVARRERLAVFALLALALLLRIAYARAWRVDSDEPQHLHVAWAWAQGLVPYRDFFDNHVPLFHLLLAPFVALVGETPRILLLARFAMFPLYGLVLWAAFSVGRSLFGARAGAWAVPLLAVHKEFFLKSIETRTDDLWTALWWAGMAVLVGGRWSRRRGFLAGVLLGAAAGSSLKTLLLMGTLATAAAIAFVLLPRPLRPLSFRAAAVRLALPVLTGALVVPAALAGLLLAHGAADDLVRCLFTHSRVPGDGPPLDPWAGGSLLLAVTAACALVAWRFVRSGFAPGDRARQLVVLVGPVLQLSVLYSVWPANTAQDSMPVQVAGAILLAPVLLAAVDSVARRLPPSATTRRAALPVAVLVAVSASSVGRLLHDASVTRDGTRAAATYVGDVLRLVDRGEFVMDPKGESIFRPRPVYAVFERFTMERIARGLMEDPLPAGLVGTRTCVVHPKLSRYTEASAAFVRSAYVPVGSLRVAGRFLGQGTSPGVPTRFDLAIPGRYAVVARSGDAFHGTVDGIPYAGPLDLAAGPHAILPSHDEGPLAVLWSRAIERGFAPVWPTTSPP